MKLSEIPTKELEDELKNRKDRHTPMCIGCHGKWQTYYAFAPYIGETLHCHGCNRPVEKCTCRS
jgi:hypothetical protein